MPVARPSVEYLYKFSGLNIKGVGESQVKPLTSGFPLFISICAALIIESVSHAQQLVKISLSSCVILRSGIHDVGHSLVLGAQLSYNEK